MDASFFYKPFSQSECSDNKKSCHLLEKKGTHPMRMHVNNTIYNRSNQNAGFLDTTNTTCNRSNQNASFPDTHTHTHSTNQHPAAPDTTKPRVTEARHNAEKHFLLFWWGFHVTTGQKCVLQPYQKAWWHITLNHLNPAEVFFCVCRKLSGLLSIENSGSVRLTNWKLTLVVLVEYEFTVTVM